MDNTGELIFSYGLFLQEKHFQLELPIETFVDCILFSSAVSEANKIQFSI